MSQLDIMIDVMNSNQESCTAGNGWHSVCYSAIMCCITSSEAALKEINQEISCMKYPSLV